MIFCHFGSFFALLPRYSARKLKFGKNVKKLGDIILLHMCTINEDHMMCGSRYIRNEGQRFLSFWAIFALWTSNFEKMKKNHLEISSFYTSVPQMAIIWCMVPQISSARDRILCHLWLFFPFYPPNNSENKNFGKIKTMPEDIIIFHMCTINENHMMYGSCYMERDRQNFFSFWTIFRPFTPHKKIKILKKQNKKRLEIS